MHKKRLAQDESLNIRFGFLGNILGIWNKANKVLGFLSLFILCACIIALFFIIEFVLPRKYLVFQVPRELTLLIVLAS